MPRHAVTPNVRARPLRMRLLILAASGLLPLGALVAWGIFHLVQERQVQSEQAVSNMSRALATTVEAELRSTTVQLDQMGISDELERADFRAFYSSAQRTAQLSGWREMVLSDPDGRALFRTTQPYGASDPTARETESLSRVVATRQPAIGPVVTDGTKEVFRVRVPVLREAKLIYVLTAVVPVEKIGAVLSRQNLSVDSVAAVFDQAQYRVARSRPAPAPTPSPSLKAMLDRGNDQGVGRTITRDGIESFSGYTRLKDSGWVVAVAVSVDEAYRDLYALFRAVALGLAASLALSVLLAWLLSRKVIEPIEQLKEGAAALGRGDPVRLPRLDIAELDDVAVSLTNAALERDRAADERGRMGSQVAQALHSAEDANRSKDQFLAMLGHELRNPLAPIMNAVQLMALKGDATTAPERKIIERQLMHVTRLVDDLLDVSRITGGRLNIHPEPIRLGALLTQLTDTIRPSLHERELTLELKPGAESAWVSGDEVRLTQVFNNLLVNAIKFTPVGGKVFMRAAVSGQHMQIDVEDTGMGIASEDLRHVFELFYQAPQSNDRARGGLGLGLPIVRSLVEMHGGSTSGDSAGPGMGSCFTVRLPLCQPPVDSQGPASQPAAQGAGHVLVVDDNEDAADTCAMLLELNGYEVRVAYTPEQAMQLMAQQHPDVAVLDIGLPGMSGYELAQALRAAPYNYRGRLLALTGYGQATDRAASARSGFNGHITKPVAPATLLRLIDRLLRERSEGQVDFIDSSSDSR